MSHFALCICLLSFAATLGGEALRAQTPTAEELIEQVVREQRAGNLEAAWQELTAFYAHPGRNEVGLEAFANCFLLSGCPSIGYLGALLGKSKRQAGDLASFCPHWRGQRALIEASDDAEIISRAEQQFDVILTRGLNGSCTEWYERELARLYKVPVLQRARRPLVLPIAFMEPIAPAVEQMLEGQWPVIEVVVDGWPVAALVDSGAGMTNINHVGTPWREILHDMEALTTLDILGSGGIQQQEVFRLSNIQLGSSFFYQLMVAGPREPMILDPEFTVGMNVLLRYPAVCFHWAEAEIHLGDTGPCAAGVSPGNARLTGKFSIMLEISMADGSALDVLLDTGALNTPCSQRFIDSNGGEWTFSFGFHSKLVALCSRVTDFPPALPGQFQALIGMDTLRRFDAFGWELNPLRVYFVPKQSGN